jgi:hypothetical protein
MRNCVHQEIATAMLAATPFLHPGARSLAGLHSTNNVMEINATRDDVGTPTPPQQILCSLSFSWFSHRHRPFPSLEMKGRTPVKAKPAAAGAGAKKPAPTRAAAGGTVLPSLGGHATGKARSAAPPTGAAAAPAAASAAGPSAPSTAQESNRSNITGASDSGSSAPGTAFSQPPAAASNPGTASTQPSTAEAELPPGISLSQPPPPSDSAPAADGAQAQPQHAHAHGQGQEFGAGVTLEAFVKQQSAGPTLPARLKKKLGVSPSPLRTQVNTLNTERRKGWQWVV